MHLFKMKSMHLQNKILVKRTVKAGYIILLIGIIYFTWYRLTHLGIPCVFHLLTGLYCPGCGITRMFISLSQLKFWEAIQHNCFVLLFLPYGVFVYVRNCVHLLITGEKYQYKKYQRYIFFVILILACVFGVIRNIPAFYFLRP